MLDFVRWTVLAFSLVLVVAGITPLLRPEAVGTTSSAPAYALFHLLSAAVGLASFAYRGGEWAPWFALGFGVADLYQAVASLAGWFPIRQFRWTPTDDALHWGLGAALVALGVLGLLLGRRMR